LPQRAQRKARIIEIGFLGVLSDLARDIGLKSNDLAEHAEEEQKEQKLKKVYLALLASWREIEG